MDLNPIIASVGTTILGLGAVTAYLKKYIPKVIEYARIARHALDLVDDLLAALGDEKLTPEEIEALTKDAKMLKEDLKALSII